MKPLALALAAAFFCAPARAASDPAFDGSGGTSATSRLLERRPAKLRVSRKTAAAPGGDERSWVIVEAGTAGQRTQVATAGVAIEEVRPGEVAGIASAHSVARLRRLGFALRTVPLPARFSAQDFPREDSAFHDYDRTVAALRALAGEAPELASLFSFGRSTQGRDLWVLRLNASAKGAAPSAKPGVFFMGTIHAREHLATEVPLLLAKYLVDHRDRADVKALLADRDVYIAPMVNPDGVEYDIRDGSYHMHRKNMRPNPDGSFGVDLNRNFAWGWGGEGASGDPGDETYRGPSAFSEPESQAIKAFIDARPNLKILLSYHTYSELILYPWGGSDSPIGDSKALAAFKAMADRMGAWTGYTPEQSSALYIATGDACDWAWGAHKIFAFTFELTPKSMWDGGFYPGAAAIQSTFAANLKPALYLIGLADDPLRAAQGQPVTAAGQAAAAGGR